MAGTVAGGRKARDTNRKEHGDDFYKRIGKIGGQKGRGPGYQGGFACKEKGKDGLTGSERAKLVGAIGGFRSKRGPAKKKGEADA